MMTSKLPKKPPPSKLAMFGYPFALLFSIYSFFQIGFNLEDFKRNLANSKKIKQNLRIKMKYFEKFLTIKIEYLELRSIKNLKISNTVKGSRLFVAYYIDNIRLIDNF